MINPPCYDTRTKADCPKRCLGCRSTCEEWQQYEKDYSKNLDHINRKRTEDREIDAFLSQQSRRIQLRNKANRTQKCRGNIHE